MVKTTILVRLDVDTRLEHYHYCLLQEALAKLDQEGRTRMRFSEFFAVFHPEQMCYLNEPTQLLVRSHIGVPEEWNQQIQLFHNINS